MKTKEDIGSWYDGFAGKQLRTSVNLRHYRIMEFLVHAGLKKNYKVLEIGCGIGTLTGLLAKYLKRGRILAVDISRDSVKIAQERLAKAKNVSFLVTDMTDFSYPEKFDFIVLPDVLEHIPEEQHISLFRTLSGHMHDTSVILIHIPHPKALDYIRKNFPETMQIIDQSVSAASLISNACQNDLILVSYNSYPLFDRENDYAVITFRKNREINLVPLPQSIIIMRKLILRFRFLIARI